MVRSKSLQKSCCSNNINVGSLNARMAVGLLGLSFFSGLQLLYFHLSGNSATLRRIMDEPNFGVMGQHDEYVAHDDEHGKGSYGFNTSMTVDAEYRPIRKDANLVTMRCAADGKYPFLMHGGVCIMSPLVVEVIRFAVGKKELDVVC